MFAQLTLAAALFAQGAPIPKDTAVSGPAPKVVDLKADANGKFMMTVIRQEKRTVNVATAIAPAGGGAVQPVVQEREITSNVSVTVEIKDLKDLKITTAGGKDVPVADAMKQIGHGATVVMSSDGKPVGTNFLRVFKDDTLVFSSPDLASVQTGNSTLPIRGGGVIRPGGRPVPVPLPAIQPRVLPANGGIQIQILPAIPVEIEIAPPAPEKK